VAELMMDRDMGGDTRLMRVGLPDRFVTHGKPALLHQEVGLTPEAVVERVLEAVGSRSRALA
jgi:1-deoxy-D-xylulose-5-phosphate synthase